MQAAERTPSTSTAELSLARLNSLSGSRAAKELKSKPSAETVGKAAMPFAVKANGHSKNDLADSVSHQLFGSVLSESEDYGPIQPLIDDPEVTEIMVNGPSRVYVECGGRLEKTEISFADDEAVMRLIEQIILPLGRRVDANNPTVDARLPDGSRVNAVIPPVAIDGPGLTIRRFPSETMNAEDLIQFGSLSTDMAEFLRACVMSRLNILVSGGTGSGKTTLLNILSGFIPERERIVTIEDAAELQLQQEHIFRLEMKPPDPDGEGEVSIRHLVRNALRMRPDRIIVGEVRGGEALDMLQAMNTGHDGSLTTLHANTPRDAVSRLETLVLLAGFDLPLPVVRQQISSAVDLIVQQTRLRDGSRKVTAITEVVGMEGDTVVLNEIFKFKENGVDESGHISGEFNPTGMRPMFGPRLEAAGFKLSPELFGAGKIDFQSHRKRKS